MKAFVENTLGEMSCYVSCQWNVSRWYVHKRSIWSSLWCDIVYRLFELWIFRRTMTRTMVNHMIYQDDCVPVSVAFIQLYKLSVILMTIGCPFCTYFLYFHTFIRIFVFHTHWFERSIMWCYHLMVNAKFVCRSKKRILSFIKTAILLVLISHKTCGPFYL